MIRMVRQGKVMSCQLAEVEIQADTVCIHGDGEHALDFARTIREALEQAGVTVRAPGRIVDGSGV
ncbi:putative LamB/YcsF family protein [Paenibacillus sp. 598K]|nr:putative LamB/YcsF family protein [Paenibacillus sp. 598K]